MRFDVKMPGLRNGWYRSCRLQVLAYLLRMHVYIMSRVTCAVSAQDGQLAHVGIRRGIKQDSCLSSCSHCGVGRSRWIHPSKVAQNEYSDISKPLVSFLVRINEFEP